MPNTPEPESCNPRAVESGTPKRPPPRAVDRPLAETPEPSVGRTEETVSYVAHADAARVPEEPPAQFGQYQIVRRLGRGGMGTVYLAKDAQLNRDVAIKIPSLTADDSPDLLQRFLREARAAAAINHPNICPVYDAGVIDGIYYMVMAYVEGKPLTELLHSHKELPQEKVAALVRKMAAAVQEAHELGFIHRDLKPSNVMMTPAGEPVVMDFGLARRVGKDQSRLTKTGMVMGTPAYMAPEQLTGDIARQGPGCDIYSLGVVLYELLTGQRPFTGDVIVIASRIALEEPTPPSEHRPELDPMLEVICLKAMAKKLEERYASMADFSAALAKYLRYKSRHRAKGTGEQPADGTRKVSGERLLATATTPGSSVQSWPWIAGAVTLVLLLLVVALVARPGRDEPVADSRGADRAGTLVGPQTGGEPVVRIRAELPSLSSQVGRAPTDASTTTDGSRPTPTRRPTDGSAEPEPLEPQPKASTPGASARSPLRPDGTSEPGPPGSLPISTVGTSGRTKGSADPKPSAAMPAPGAAAGKASDKSTTKIEAKTKDAKSDDDPEKRKPKKVQPTKARLRLSLAKEYLRKGEKERAFNYLYEVIDLAPESKYADEARRLLKGTD